MYSAYARCLTYMLNSAGRTQRLRRRFLAGPSQGAATSRRQADRHEQSDASSDRSRHPPCCSLDRTGIAQQRAAASQFGRNVESAPLSAEGNVAQRALDKLHARRLCCLPRPVAGAVARCPLSCNVARLSGRLEQLDEAKRCPAYSLHTVRMQPSREPQPGSIASALCCALSSLEHWSSLQPANHCSCLDISHAAVASFLCMHMLSLC